MKKLLLCVLVVLFLSRSNSQSLRFNGSTNYVNLTNDAALHLTSFTVEAWIKTEGIGAMATTGIGGVTAVPVVTKGRGEADAPASVNVNYLLGIDANKKLVADFEESSGGNHPVVSNTSIADNTWTHVAVTYNAASAVWKLYINGVLDATKDLGSNIMPASTSIQPAAIGSALNSGAVPSGYFKGRIDEVRIWNITRPDSAIRNNYKLELVRGSGLVARYSLNAGSGTTAKNTISTAATGALINGPQWITGYNNAAPYAPANPSPASGAYADPASTKLCATVSDKNNDRLRVKFYGRKKVTNEKFTIVLLPDTQFYTAEPQGKNGGTNAMFKSQTNWIAKNRGGKNIVYVGQLGDCVENGDRYEKEWRRADTALKTIESKSRTGLEWGIPYGICVGNHDQSPFGDPNGTTRFYNSYFGTSRFSGRPYYGGHAGSNNDNHYQLFSAAGYDFLVLCPEYDQTSGFSAAGGTLDWMETVVKAYPNHNVIVLSHYVLKIDATFTTQGNAIYGRLKKYPNFILMAGGHITQGDGESRRSDTYNGNTVHTLASDYQTRANGGNGRLRLLQLDPAAKTISVQTYSPYTNSFETDANSQFSLNVVLRSPLRPFTLIGEVVNLKPGSTGCISWSPLETDAAYEWYARVWDGERTTTGPTWWFTTKTSTTTAMHYENNEVPYEHVGHLSRNGLFTLYPNPSSSTMTLAFSHEIKGPVTAAVFDATGSLRFRRSYTNPGSRISISHMLPTGTYTILVTTEKEEAAATLLVTKAS